MIVLCALIMILRQCSDIFVLTMLLIQNIHL
ncbi:hypothetical protein KP509_1Z042200 [Ceratopteris richardii]|nr:hypothetical protein KP509_1Z042200 [Ceratopteris richardii]